MIFDIVLLVVALIFVLVGLKKGFIRSIIGLLGAIVSLVVTILLAKSFANFLSGFIPFDKWIGAPLLEKFSANAALSAEVPATKEAMEAALKTAGVPSFLCGILAGPIFSAIPEGMEGSSMAAFLAPYVTDLIVIGISAVVLFILIRIAVAILEHFAKKLAHVQFVNVVDKSLGMVLGLGECFLFVLCVMTVMTLMMGLKFMAPVQKQIDESKVAKFLYENNFIAKFISEKFDAGKNQPEESPSPSQSPEESPENTEEPQSAANERIYLDGKQYLIRYPI